MPDVTLEQVLAEREARVQLQKKLLDIHRCPVISFTMNIAGPEKITPLIQRAFRAGCAALDAALASFTVLGRTEDYLPTGCRMLCAVKADARTLKDICTAIEEQTPLGRLFDIDVIGADGEKLSRREMRGCIVCGAPGRACAAGRLHAVAELQSATRAIITAHFVEVDRDRIASAASSALIREVMTTPKPGLVDQRNTGSHRDMNLQTFVDSANALTPYFAECIEIGQTTKEATPATVFPVLRRAGLAAEQAMYAATHGVNTHKGIIYAMGLLCAAIGRLWTPEQPATPAAQILQTAAALVRDAVTEDLAAADGKTAGERLYLAHGITGIRGEAADGFPAIANISLPFYTAARARGTDENTAAVLTLLQLIAAVQDTNLYHRGGLAGAAYAASCARDLLSQAEAPTMAAIEALDDAFIARNLSPGGCADLLALTLFLHDLQSLE